MNIENSMYLKETISTTTLLHVHNCLTQLHLPPLECVSKTSISHKIPCEMCYKIIQIPFHQQRWKNGELGHRIRGQDKTHNTTQRKRKERTMMKFGKKISLVSEEKIYGWIYIRCCHFMWQPKESVIPQSRGTWPLQLLILTLFLQLVYTSPRTSLPVFQPAAEIVLGKTELASKEMRKEIFYVKSTSRLSAIALSEISFNLLSHLLLYKT